MKIYLAGFDAAMSKKFAKIANYHHLLISYYTSYYKKNKVETKIKEDLELIDTSKTFLDSGGFTARVQRIDIDIQKYKNFIKSYGQHYEIICNLDEIDYEKSQRNLEILLQTKYKDKILPVYHYSEFKDKQLKTQLVELCKKFNFIAIGGMVEKRMPKREQYRFLNYCFSIAREFKTKFHGFGVTAWHLLKRYPFYSVDSTSWLAGGKYGAILENNSMQAKSFSYKNKQKVFNTQLSTKFMTHYNSRCIHNIKMYKKYEKTITDLWKKRGVDWLD